MEIRKTPFFELEKKEGAFFTEFAGWYLPLHFGSAIEEVLSVRQNVGFFDISHMGLSAPLPIARAVRVRAPYAK
jgi:glycine cleavage system aminomethyltransferase T